MHSIAWWPTLAAVAMATVTDLRSHRIPNWLVGPFLVLGVGVLAWAHGWHGLVQSAEGMGLGLASFGFLFVAGGMGAGDVKLMAAIGAWVGPRQLLLALLMTALAGGAMALGWAIWEGFLGELLEGASALLPLGKKAASARIGSERAEEGVGNKASIRRAIPYAPAIAIGTLLSFFGHL